jgi:presenilin-like A22 family membrane protease
LIIFSLYDYIAVYKTKHMIHMAREMIKEGAVLGLVLPQKTSDFKSPLQKVVPGAGRFFVLGGGDVVFPLLLCSSVLPRGLTHSLVVAGFSLFGLFLSIFVFSRQKKRQPIPALPPIALFAIIGYAATLLF